MDDTGFLLSLQAIRSQLTAMPCGSYLIRLIHHSTRKSLPGERLWPAAQLLLEPTIRFLRARNREGFDVYFRPYASDHNAGFILIDLDNTQPTVLAAMRSNGHEPCVVLETSPGHLQAWVRVSIMPLPPQVATPVSRHLACLYQADRASADWRHVGRLAGFTNQKPKRRLPSGLAPWVKVRYAAPGLVSNSQRLLESAVFPSGAAMLRARPHRLPTAPHCDAAADPAIDSVQAMAIYQNWLNHLQIPQRFTPPDWSIADLWIAKQLLSQGATASRVKSVLRLASPQFPRGHADPEDYLRRTLARAAPEITGASFPARTAPHPRY